MDNLESYLKNKKHFGPVYGLLILLGQNAELRLWDCLKYDEMDFEKLIIHCGEGRERVYSLVPDELNIEKFGDIFRKGLHCFKFENGTLEIL